MFRHKEPNEMQNAMRYYDRKNPASNKEIIDEWFQQLSDHASSTIEKYI